MIAFDYKSAAGIRNDFGLTNESKWCVHIGLSMIVSAIVMVPPGTFVDSQVHEPPWLTPDPRRKGGQPCSREIQPVALTMLIK